MIHHQVKVEDMFRKTQIRDTPTSNHNLVKEISTILANLDDRICHKFGHTAIDCFQRLNMSYIGRHPPEKLVAVVAQQSGGFTDGVWYDIGASHHITPNNSNVTNSTPYAGSDSVQVGNDSILRTRVQGRFYIRTKLKTVSIHSISSHVHLLKSAILLYLLLF